jgi:putative addiction module component (TIGR02574 family)
MNHDVQALTEAARQLTPDERIELVENILQTLAGTDVEVERAWAREATDRYEAHLRGELTARDAADVIADIRARQASR